MDEVEQLYHHFQSQDALAVAVRLALVSLNSKTRLDFWTNEVADLGIRLRKSSAPSLIHQALVADVHVLRCSRDCPSREERYRRLEEEYQRWTACGLRSRYLEWMCQRFDTTESISKTQLSQYNQSLKFADQAHGIANYQWERQQLHAAGSACRTAMKETLQSSSLNEIRENYHYLRCRLVTLDLMLTRSAFLLGETLARFSDAYDDLEREEYVVLIERVISDFPRLEVPKINAAIFSQAGLCANALGNTSKGQEFYAKEKDSEWQLPIAEYRVVDEKFVATKVVKLNPRENYAALLHSHDEELRVRNCMVYLIQWMQEDSDAGRLKLADLRDSLPLAVASKSEKGLGTSASEAKLDARPPPDDLFAHLFSASVSDNLPATESEWFIKFAPLKDWLLRKSPAYNTEQIEFRHTVLKELFSWRFKSLRDQAMKIMQETGKIDDPTAFALYSTYIMGKDTLGHASGGEDSVQDEYAMKAISALSLSNSAVQKRQLNAAMLNDYDVLGEKVCERHEDQGRLVKLYNELFQRALVMNRRDQRFTKAWNIPVESNDLSRTLLLLEEADRHYVTLRQASAALLLRRRFGSEDFDSQHALTQHLPQSAVYKLAITAALGNYMRALAAGAKELRNRGHGHQPSLTQHCQARLLTWVERSKARILTETLGSHGYFPTRLLASNIEGSVGKCSLAKESDLINDLLAIHPDDLVAQWKASKALRQHQESLRKDKSLSEIMALRDGVPVLVQQTADLLRRLDERVTIVSYFEVENHPASDLWMAIYAAGRDPVIVPTIRMNLVKEWIKVSFGNKTPLAHPVFSWNNLALYSELIRPLEYLTCPGDHVVFCPFQELHLIPFHALLLGNKLLIERNPVSYCPSLSVLFQLHNTWECSSQDAKARVSLIHVLPNEGDRIDTFYSDLASSLGSAALTGTFVPTKQATDSLQDATLFCFHGHGDYQEQGTKKRPRHPFEQALDLGRRGKNPDIPGDYGEKGKLTANEVFDIPLQPGALAMLIACESGKAQISDTDEHLGLNTAFYHAGAASVISTLWKIEKEDGNTFVRAFFKYLKEARTAEPESRSGVPSIDLAVVMQKTICELLERVGENGVRMPGYRWAGITLNGFWRLPMRFLPEFK